LDDLLFEPEDGGNMLLRNVGISPTCRTTSFVNNVRTLNPTLVGQTDETRADTTKLKSILKKIWNEYIDIDNGETGDYPGETPRRNRSIQ
jgi:hypothetical protein